VASKAPVAGLCVLKRLASATVREAVVFAARRPLFFFGFFKRLCSWPDAAWEGAAQDQIAFNLCQNLIMPT
jgi:hypothetical protein